MLEEIITSGDRTELKKWLKECSNEDLASNWVKFSALRVQDFGRLVTDELERRGMIRRMVL